MKLLSSLAQRIVKEVTHIVNEEVIVVNDRGTIIAASDERRVGNFHEGAYIAVNTKTQFIIRKRDVPRLQGVKAGLNLPITIENQVIGVIGITGEPEQVVQFGQLIQRMTELIIHEAYSSQRLESKHRGLETFVYEWVHKEQLDKDFLERGEILGISMFEPRVCVLFELENSEEELNSERVFEDDIADNIRDYFTENSQDIVIRWGNGRFVLLKHVANESTAYLKQTLSQCQEKLFKSKKASLFIGAGKITQKPSGLHKSYHDAKKALRAAKKQQRLMLYSDLTLDMALAEITDDTRQEVVEKVLGPVLYDRELMDTLNSFFECDLSMKETAKKQHIHINTLHYRLKRVADLTGRPVKDTEHLVSLYLALSFLAESDT